MNSSNFPNVWIDPGCQGVERNPQNGQWRYDKDLTCDQCGATIPAGTWFVSHLASFAHIAIKHPSCVSH